MPSEQTERETFQNLSSKNCSPNYLCEESDFDQSREPSETYITIGMDKYESFIHIKSKTNEFKRECENEDVDEANVAALALLCSSADNGIAVYENISIDERYTSNPSDDSSRTITYQQDSYDSNLTNLGVCGTDNYDYASGATVDQSNENTALYFNDE
ncbi:unnamed protein product [Protopolystoma xenopodis]|uniref:Uncharacterized protein n=1 Tax=Protopolystoma xenopodis TaxID=117903 RepID=A0A3S4ZTA4_9PLAT|nr:unnamed protein product [Protopolystoma xenopodis]